MPRWGTCPGHWNFGISHPHWSWRDALPLPPPKKACKVHQNTPVHAKMYKLTMGDDMGIFPLCEGITPSLSASGTSILVIFVPPSLALGRNTAVAVRGDEERATRRCTAWQGRASRPLLLRLRRRRGGRNPRFIISRATWAVSRRTVCR